MKVQCNAPFNLSREWSLNEKMGLQIIQVIDSSHWDWFSFLQFSKNKLISFAEVWKHLSALSAFTFHYTDLNSIGVLFRVLGREEQMAEWKRSHGNENFKDEMLDVPGRRNDAANWTKAVANVRESTEHGDRSAAKTGERHQASSQVNPPRPWVASAEVQTEALTRINNIVPRIFF